MIYRLIHATVLLLEIKPMWPFADSQIKHKLTHSQGSIRHTRTSHTTTLCSDWVHATPPRLIIRHLVALRNSQFKLTCSDHWINKQKWITYRLHGTGRGNLWLQTFSSWQNMSEPNLSQVPLVLFPCRQQIVAALCCYVKHLRPIFGLENAFSNYKRVIRE